MFAVVSTLVPLGERRTLLASGVQGGGDQILGLPGVEDSCYKTKKGEAPQGDEDEMIIRL